MHPYYNESTGHLIIEWYEKRKNGSPVHHHYGQKPMKLQLHPIDPKKVIRASFGDKMPGWLHLYAKEHDYRCQQVTKDGEVGFWIANWNVYPNGEKPITVPNIEGALEQFTRSIPDVCDKLKQLVLENREVIKNNLLHYPEAYNIFGLYYRSEEISGDGGSIVVLNDCFPRRETGEDDDQYLSRIEKDGRLEGLVYELINPLPAPVDEVPEDEMEELIIDSIDFEESEEELIITGLEFEEIQEDEKIVEEPENESEDLSLESVELEEDELSDDSEDDLGEEEAGPIISPNNPKSESDSDDDKADYADVAHTEHVESMSSLVEPEKSVEKVEGSVELQVTDDPSNKVVEGQFMLF